jgi:hypothetical protein
MGSAIAQMVKIFWFSKIDATAIPKNKKWEATDAMRYPWLPIPVDANLVYKNFKCKNGFVNILLGIIFWKIFHFNGGLGGRHNADFVALPGVAKGDKS